MTRKNKSDISRIGFLFGAGASIAAGIPDMKEFIALFSKYINEKEPSLNKHYEEILAIINSDNEPELERMMITLEILSGQIPNGTIFEKFRPLKKEYSANMHHFDQIQELLKRFIASSTFVNDHSRVKFLDKFIDIIKDFHPYPRLFTVNYDTVLELALARNGLNYTDGYNPDWDPDLFNQEDVVSLFKLHGSCTWYTTGKTYIKIPIKPVEHTLELLDGGMISNMVIYPGFMKNYSIEPLSIMLYEFRKDLSQMEVLFIVGYSCRDAEISMILSDVKRINPDLRIFLIDKDPKQCIDNMNDVDETLQSITYPISSTWNNIIRYNRIEDILSNYYKGREKYYKERYPEREDGDEWISVGGGPSSYAEEARKSFNTDLLSMIFKRESIKVKEGTITRHNEDTVYSNLLESSFGLLYYSIIMDKYEEQRSYYESIMNCIDNHFSQRRCGKPLKASLRKFPKEFNEQHFSDGTLSNLYEVTRFDIHRWAEWLKPIILNERFNDNLHLLHEAVNNNFNNDKVMENIRRLYNISNDSHEYRDAWITFRQYYMRIQQRINTLPRIDDLTELQSPLTVDRQKEFFTKYHNILNIIYKDSLQQLMIFYNVLNSNEAKL